MHGFGNIGRMIANAFEVLGNEQQMRRVADFAGIFHHVGQQLAKQRIVNLIDFSVTAPRRHRGIGITPGLGIQHILELLKRQTPHAGQPLR